MESFQGKRSFKEVRSECLRIDVFAVTIRNIIGLKRSLRELQYVCQRSEDLNFRATSKFIHALFMMISAGDAAGVVPSWEHIQEHVQPLTGRTNQEDAQHADANF